MTTLNLLGTLANQGIGAGATTDFTGFITFDTTLPPLTPFSQTGTSGPVIDYGFSFGHFPLLSALPDPVFNCCEPGVTIDGRLPSTTGKGWFVDIKTPDFRHAILFDDTGLSWTFAPPPNVNAFFFSQNLAPLFPPSPVPEASSMTLLVVGLIFAALFQSARKLWSK